MLDKLNQGKSMAIRVSMAFCKYSDGPLIPFAVGVRDGLAGNPTLFPDPPVSPADLDAANKTFELALAAANKGSEAQTEAKNNARLALIALLRELAAYVDSKARGDVQIILVSGFDFVNRGHSPQLQLPKPNIQRIRNERTTQLVVSVKRVPTARSFEAQVRIGQGPWQAAGTHPQARRIVLQDLVPGTLYWIRVRAVGGSTGYSEWSDAVSHMCM
jgi:hypothetical protein